MLCLLDGAKAGNDHGNQEEEGDEDDEEGDDDERHKEVALGFTVHLVIRECMIAGLRTRTSSSDAFAVGKVSRGGA